MVRVVAFAGGVEPRNVRRLLARAALHQIVVGVGLVVAPQPAHRVMDGGEDLHRLVPRVDSLELLVDLHDAAELAIEDGGGNVRDVEVDGVLALDAHSHVLHHREDLARGDVARNQVSVPGIFLLEEMPALVLGNVLSPALVAFLLGHPDAPAFPTGRLGHQPVLVLSRDRGRVHLHELGVGIDGAVHV